MFLFSLWLSHDSPHIAKNVCFSFVNLPYSFSLFEFASFFFPLEKVGGAEEFFGSFPSFMWMCPVSGLESIPLLFRTTELVSWWVTLCHALVSLSISLGPSLIITATNLNFIYNQAHWWDIAGKQYIKVAAEYTIYYSR